MNVVHGLHDDAHCVLCFYLLGIQAVLRDDAAGLTIMEVETTACCHLAVRIVDNFGFSLWAA